MIVGVVGNSILGGLSKGKDFAKGRFTIVST